jgi:hypothetical protein
MPSVIIHSVIMLSVVIPSVVVPRLPKLKLKAAQATIRLYVTPST